MYTIVPSFHYANHYAPSRFVIKTTPRAAAANRRYEHEFLLIPATREHEIYSQYAPPYNTVPSTSSWYTLPSYTRLCKCMFAYLWTPNHHRPQHVGCVAIMKSSSAKAHAIISKLRPWQRQNRDPNTQQKKIPRTNESIVQLLFKHKYLVATSACMAETRPAPHDAHVKTLERRDWCAERRVVTRKMLRAMIWCR